MGDFISKSNYNYDKTIFTTELAIKDAKARVEEITDVQVDLYANKQKKFILTKYLSITLLVFLVAIVNLCVYFTLLRKPFYIVCCGLFCLVGLILIIVLCVKIRKDKVLLALERLENEYISIYSKITSAIFADYIAFVKKTSQLYKDIVSLNSNYKFNYDILKNYFYRFQLKSKRAVENCDFYNHLREIINSNSYIFDNIESTYNKNYNNYLTYQAEYRKINNFRKRETVENSQCPFIYEIYKHIEIYLYNSNKLKAVSKPSIEIKVEYTSPAGRNYYYDNRKFSYEEIVNYKKQLASIQLKETLQQQAKKEKERKLRDLGRFEKQVIAREQELKEKEQEFAEATKGHIYSTEKKEEIAVATVEQGELSSYQKLKLLKKQFENGEITREEYTKLRNELL